MPPPFNAAMTNAPPADLPHPAAAPPRGWNSFDSFGIVADERAILENLDVFVERLVPHGYRTFTLDAGWYNRFRRAPGARFPTEARDAIVGATLDGFGRFLPCPDRFPSGFGEIARKCHDAGVAFGLHLMRGVPRAAVEADLPVLGTGYTARRIADVRDVCPWCADNYGVDMSAPGAQAYYDSVLALLAEWGVDYVKVDDVVPFPREVRAVADAIARSGRPMTLSLSPGNELCAADLPDFRRANALRVTADVWDRREDLSKGFAAMQLWAGQERPGFWIDLDMIPFGELSVWRESADETGDRPLLYGKGVRRQSRFTAAQKRTFLAQRSLAASPLIMGGNLPETPDDDFALLTNPHVMACNDNGTMARVTARGRDWLAFAVADRADPRRGWATVFNTSPAALDVTVGPRQFGLAGGRWQVADGWSDGPWETLADDRRLSLAADDVWFVRYRCGR